MPRLKIATNFSLPVDLVTQTVAVLAKRGAGKTYFALVVAEEMLKAGLQVVLADPVGVTWGLRAAANGRDPGLPIIVMGGEHGDVPLEATAGRVVADFVVGEVQSVVLDMSLFRKAEQVRFMADFAERLYHANRKALHLILDEADLFAPQRPMHDQARMLGAVEDLVRRGRARGIGVMLVTQRAAVLNKDVLTQVEVLVALRTIAPQDRDAVDAWVKVHGTPEERERLMSSLASLPIGDAWVWSPAWLGLFRRITVRPRETFDSSATPEVGVIVREPRRLAPVDLDALTKRIAATIERAKAEDPRELRRRIAELEAEVRRKLAVPPPAPVRRAPVVRQATAQQLERVVARLIKTADAGEGRVRALADLWGGVKKFGEVLLSALQDAVSAPASPSLAVRVVTAAPPARKPALPGGTQGTQLRRGERRMLETLAQRHPLKLTRAQLGALAGFTPSGGTFGAYFGTLKRAGFLVEAANGDVEITSGGIACAGVVPALPQGPAERVEVWRRALRAGERRMLDILLEHRSGVSREDLGRQAGFEASGGTFGAYLGTLRRNGLADIDGDLVRPGAVLFL